MSTNTNEPASKVKLSFPVKDIHTRVYYFAATLAQNENYTKRETMSKEEQAVSIKLGTISWLRLIEKDYPSFFLTLGDNQNARQKIIDECITIVDSSKDGDSIKRQIQENVIKPINNDTKYVPPLQSQSGSQKEGNISLASDGIEYQFIFVNFHLVLNV
jgi:hypothetical protein